jgi:hypothetical protein
VGRICPTLSNLDLIEQQCKLGATLPLCRIIQKDQQMTDLSKAEAKARDIDRQLSKPHLLRMEPLAEGLGLVAYFSSDRGLRSYGQASLIQGRYHGYGLVIKPDGEIPRDAEASTILRDHNASPRPVPQC